MTEREILILMVALNEATQGTIGFFKHLGKDLPSGLVVENQSVTGSEAAALYDKLEQM